MLRLGSLFSGSGGFELAGIMNGIEPVWASEIEPYPIRVTTARFPGMKHLGSILDVDGGKVEPVDICTFGSPCQDLSVAGKQAGLHKGERSNLFFEAIRIIKEMRESTNGKYPRIAVWENVPGAYSSNKGEDFRAVLQAFCSVKDETADVPRPASGKWNPAGAIVGNGWSIAWRTFDAQYWGVPQRRRRIYLIADFGSERAGEILFEPQSVRRDTAQSGTARQSAADNVEGSAGGSGVCYPIDLIRESRGAFETYEENADKAGSLKQSDCKGSQVVCFKERAGCPGGGKGILCGDKPFTLSTTTDQAVCYAISGKQQSLATSECLANTLGANDYKEPQSICYALQGNGIDRADTAGCNGAGWREGECYTLNTIDRPAVCYPVENHPNDSRVSIREDGIVPTLSSRMGTGGNNGPMVLETTKPPRKYIIRRLTPLECCRLQGFPDWWEDGVQGSDSARYKMWGNGIALPNAEYVIGCAKKLIDKIV